ncbi:AraC family transcriptional regulator [Flavihumibacter solisilvae]|uniref:AraC family transcriptional regulator n=1 Tax=Flavihumibacter solisilvae TaxID=1349421 RepID=UPI001364D3E9|nr:AraC family transcriptional regulator [Flavihumibacter solisilvae]
MRRGLSVEFNCNNDIGDFEWVFVREGVLFEKVEGKVSLVIPARMMHIDRNYTSTRYYQVQGPRTTHVCFVHASNEFMGNWLARLSLQRLDPLLRNENMASFIGRVLPMGLTHFTSLLQVFSHPGEQEGTMENLIHKLDWLLADSLLNMVYHRSRHPSPQHSNDEDRVLRAVECTLDDLDQLFELETLAKMAGLNTTRLQTLFKVLFGQTVMQFYRNARLEKARDLVGETSRPLNIIAHTLGFSNANYFSQVFKQKFGLTPKAYRKEYKEKLKTFS